MLRLATLLVSALFLLGDLSITHAYNPLDDCVMIDGDIDCDRGSSLIVRNLDKIVLTLGLLWTAFFVARLLYRSAVEVRMTDEEWQKANPQFELLRRERKLGLSFYLLAAMLIYCVAHFGLHFIAPDTAKALF